MSLTASEKDELREYILGRACGEFRRGEPCVQRNNSAMVGDAHAACAQVQEMLDLVNRA